MGLFSDLRMKGRKVVAEPDGAVLFKGAVLMAGGNYRRIHSADGI